MEWTKILNHVSSIKVKSVTDSLFKFGVILILIGVLCAIFTDKDWVLVVVFCFSGLFIFIGIIFFCYFALKQPEYLRSETFQTQKQALELLGDNDRANNKNLTKLHLITNLTSPNKNKDDENPLIE